MGKLSQQEKARARLKKMQKGGDKDDSYLTLEEGKNIIHVCPGSGDDDDWYGETAKHFFNQQGYNDPKFIDRKCPACNKAAKIKKEAYDIKDRYEKGGESDIKLRKAMDKAFSQYQALKSGNRFYLNVVPLMIGDEKVSGHEVKVLEVGPKIMNEILKFYTDPDEYGNILDWKRGRDIIIKKVKTGKAAWNVEYHVSLRDKERSTRLSSSLAEQLHDLSEKIGEYPSYDEILAAMEGREAEESGDEESEEASSKSSKKKKRYEEESDEESGDESSDESSDEFSDDDEHLESSDESSDEEESDRRSTKSKLKAKSRR